MGCCLTVYLPFDPLRGSIIPHAPWQPAPKYPFFLPDGLVVGLTRNEGRLH
jgi:hypothetical protein